MLSLRVLTMVNSCYNLVHLWTTAASHPCGINDRLSYLNVLPCSLFTEHVG